LYFGALGSNPVQILPQGSISSGNGLVQISDANVAVINAISVSSPVFLEINFDTSGNPANGGTISSETDTQPIVIDLFSFVTKKSDIQTHTGIVTLDSQSYRLGQPVVITLNDPDLGTDSNSIQTYTTVNSPGSPADDTVGDASGNILLEVWIKGFRFHHCIV